MLAHRLGVAERMVFGQQVIKKRLLRRAAHQPKSERPQRAQPHDERRRIHFDRIGVPARPSLASRRIETRLFRRWQHDVPGPVKSQQQSPADHVARRAVRLLPSPGLAQHKR
ncbi:MAG: hypothetical protein ACRD3O_04765 [Terriglobia bacterium]